MIPNGKEEVSCVEKIQDLVDSLKENGNYSDEVLNNAHQLMKKIQAESKELNNVPDKEVEEEEVEESEDEESPDYENMSQDDMRKDLTKKGVIQITLGR